MPAADALLFIDANKYLDLYRTNTGRKLLGPLLEQIEHIFVTQQTVNEVQRNKVSVAATFLADKFKTLNLQTFNVPDHLSGASESQSSQILESMKNVAAEIEQVNKTVDSLAMGILEQVSQSTDEVSKSLGPIFAKAIPHSMEEYDKARERRELGNPPGKPSNAIGDQLTWEQILSHFKEKKRLWIVSRDGDYGTIYGKKSFVNPLLLDELDAVTPGAEAFLFADTIDGIRHFVESTGVKAEDRLTPEEEAEIELEERSLPPVSASSSAVSAILKAHQQALGPTSFVSALLKAYQQALSPVSSVSAILRALDAGVNLQDDEDEGHHHAEGTDDE